MTDGPIHASAVAPSPSATVPPGKPTRVRYLVLGAGCSLAVLTYILRVGFATISAELNRTIGLTDSQVGSLMAAFMIGYGLFEIPWGRLGDRLGVRNILVSVVPGASTLTAALALVIFLPSEGSSAFLFLLLLRFLFGSFQAGTFPSISRMMADWMPTAERGRAQGAIWMFSRIGGTIAPLLLTWLFTTMGDWKPPLVLVACLGVAWCLAFWPWFRNRPEQMPGVNAQERELILAGQARQPASDHTAIPWGQLLTSKSVWSLCLMYGFLGFSGNFYITLLPTYLRNHRNLTIETAGILSALPFAFGAIACLTGGSLSDLIIRRWGKSWGRRIVGAFGMSLATCSIILVPWVDHVALLGLLLTVTFVGNDLAMAPAWAAAGDIGQRHTGVLSGAMNMGASFMAAVESKVIGNLFGSHQLVLPFLILAGCYFLGAVCWLGVDGRKTLANS